MSKPTAREVLRLLEYDPASGLFRWRNPTSRQAPSWFKGSKGLRRYRRIWINGAPYLAHVIARVIVNGRWPASRTDHRDRNQSNNCWSNIRSASQSKNAFNRSVSKHNKTGERGVSLHGERYRAQIGFHGAKIHLGLFDTVSEAACARRLAERRLYQEFAP
jgi:hypothetical protein